MKIAGTSSRVPQLILRPICSVTSSTRTLSYRRLAYGRFVIYNPRWKRPTTWVIQASHRAATSAEELANQRRWEESGNCQGNEDEWRWTLNWNVITDDIIIGSCPRSTGDLDRIAKESGATAILSVQSDLCLDALQIDYSALREHGLRQGIMMTRVPIRDFDHGDQTLMLPEAVRTLAILKDLQHKVYVHCTAGINRATLTVLGYLTFVKGWELNSALHAIKSARPQANPYVDCWKNVKTRLLEGRSEEVIALSRKFFLKNESGHSKDSFSNWYAAEDLVIKDTFRRLLACSIDTITALTDLKAEASCGVCVSEDEYDRANKEIENLQYELSIQRQRLSDAMATMNTQKNHQDQSTPSKTYEVVIGNGAGMDVESHPSEVPKNSLLVYDELLRVKQEVSDLKKHIREIAMISTQALSIDSADWEDDGFEGDVVDLHEEDDEDKEV